MFGDKRTFSSLLREAKDVSLESVEAFIRFFHLLSTTVESSHLTLNLLESVEVFEVEAKIPDTSSSPIKGMKMLLAWKT